MCMVIKVLTEMLMTAIRMQFGLLQRATSRRGVTRLDGARGKKQVRRPRVRTWGLSEANLLFWRKYLWHFWYFSAPPHWLGARGIVPPLSPLVTPLISRRQTDRHFYLTSKKIRCQGEENDRKVNVSLFCSFSPSTPHFNVLRCKNILTRCLKFS